MTPARSRRRLRFAAVILANLGLAACGETTTGVPGPPGAVGGDTGGSPGTPSIDAGAGGAVGDASPRSQRLFLNAVAAADGRYVAVGEVDGDFGTDALILTSEDGTDWNVRYREGDDQLESVAFGAGRWVVAGLVGSVLVSDDAVTWRAVAAPRSDGALEVVWTGTEFLMRGQLSDGSALQASSNGTDWTDRAVGNVPRNLTVGKPGLVGALGDVAHADAIGFTDDAGAHWSSVTPLQGTRVVGLWSDGDGFSGTMRYPCCFDEMPPSDDEYFSMRSKDGRSWELQRRMDAVPGMVANIGETWVGIGARPPSGLVHRDPNGDVWTTTDQAKALAVAAGDRFVAVGFGGIWTSADGKTWTAATLPAEVVPH